MTPFCCAKFVLKCVKLASMQHCRCSTVTMIESKSKKPKACTKLPRIFLFSFFFFFLFLFFKWEEAGKLGEFFSSTDGRCQLRHECVQFLK